jgi:hypothetical protein
MAKLSKKVINQVEKIAEANYSEACDQAHTYATFALAVDSYALNAAHTAKEAGLSPAAQCRACDEVYSMYNRTNSMFRELGL